MADKNPEIQVWLAECKTKEERDTIADRSKKISGCSVLFRGIDDDGKYVVITSSTGTALTTPAVDFYGYKTYPDGPRVEMLTAFKITPHVTVEESRH